MAHSQNTDLRSRHLVDAELMDGQLAQFIASGVPLTREALMELRATIADADPPPLELDPASAAVKLTALSVEGPAGAPDVPIRVYDGRRSPDAVGCIFHVHGGGYILGDIAGLELWHRKLTADLGCVLVTVGYRLAPETSFPGNVEDCYAALSWLFHHTEELNVDPNRIGLMGESAGGGLAAALALLTRDRGEFKLAFQHLIYPMIDDRTGVSSDPHPFAGELIWTAENNHFGWASLLGAAPGSSDISPYAAAARAENLAGLPPTFLSIGALDLFVEEDIEYARRLIRAGVPTELHVYPGAFHGFDIHPTAKVSQDGRRDSLAALSRFLEG